MAQRLQAASARGGRGALRTLRWIRHDEAAGVSTMRGQARLVMLRVACAGRPTGWCAFTDRRSLRAYGGAWAGSCVGQAHHARAGCAEESVLCGAYVHGATRPAGSIRRHVHTDSLSGPTRMAVLIVDHHDGYIGWATTWPTR